MVSAHSAFQFDDRSQPGVTFPEIRHSAGWIDRRASEEIKHSSSKPGAENPSVLQGSLLQLQSGYFPEEGL